MVRGDTQTGIDPTKEDDLIPFFTLHIRSLLHLYPSSRFVYYETGGTSQLKNSLRAVFEYYVTGSLGTIYEGVYNYKENSTVVRLKMRDQSEQLLLKRQIKTLIENFNYSAATLLIGLDY